MNLMGLLGYVRFTVVDSRAGNVCQACTDTIKLGEFQGLLQLLSNKTIISKFFFQKKAKTKRMKNRQQ